ncbi:SRPBCC family protein [Amycolatopsis jejuensis]|uniref:SRPBCC family protein n=1 Tax=Amycolatopsis jejuensis TaxID=330084 RepID=UPI000527663C|nr:SRPBCC family protein [Amycolatopsis jejuensis]
MITGIDVNAPVVVHRDVVIDAPLPRAWELLTDVSSWPQWHPDITVAEADRPLRESDTFRWRAGGLDVESTVYLSKPPRRIVWGENVRGITAVHVWTFDLAGPSVHVRTEQSWAGEPVLADVEGIQAVLGDSLAAWLGYLKEAAETGRRGRAR